MEEETLNNTNTNTNVSASMSQPLPQPEIMNMNMVNGGGVTTTTTTTTNASTTITPTTATSPGGGGSLDLFGEKKKRGRPRKYDSNGNLNLTYLNATPPLPSSGFTLASPPFSSELFSSKTKRGRGRPNIASLGEWMDGEALSIIAGGNFMAHVVIVHTGEDVAGKILTFAQKSPRGICILSANGAVSNVSLRQPCSASGLGLTYEGRFEILSLTGSYTPSENNGMKSRSGGLSVSLAGPDGCVIGGGVSGLLTAASPIQLVVGSFIPHGYKPQKRKYNRAHTVASPISAGPNTMIAANLDVGENFLIPTPQLLEQSHDEPVIATSEKLDLDASPNDATAAWNGSEEFSNQKISTDINISLPDE